MLIFYLFMNYVILTSAMLTEYLHMICMYSDVRKMPYVAVRQGISVDVRWRTVCALALRHTLVKLSGRLNG